MIYAALGALFNPVLMKIYKTAPLLDKGLEASLNGDRTVGFVPTMGALHDGHLSLIRKAKEDGNLVVCSVFVNPTQFNNADDLARYPRTVNEDIALLEQAGCDALFLPETAEIYPEGYQAPNYELGTLETVLEGAFRPGHFQGVCQVVDRLLQIVKPHKLYLGQKDYQQCMVLTKLVEITNSAAEIVIFPTVREEDGLAMSSRNRRLTASGRKQASLIYQALREVAAGEGRPLPEVLADAAKKISDNGFLVDYLEVADAETLEVLAEWREGKKVILVAAIIDDVRLIDNLMMGE